MQGIAFSKWCALFEMSRRVLSLRDAYVLELQHILLDSLWVRFKSTLNKEEIK